MYDQEQPMASAQYGLTPTQRETLVTALRQGYYAVPQETTMGDLAGDLDISQQALSKPLHNGHRGLITSALTVSPPDDG